MKTRSIVLRLTSTLAFVGALGSMAACEEETTPTHVACIGDSITAGDGASVPQETYPAALQGMLGPKTTVKAFGHNGATLMGAGAGDVPYDGQAEYSAATSFVSEAGPDARVAVLLFLGTNDSKATVWDQPGRKERFVADYGKLIDHFASLPTHPTLYLVTPLGAAGKTPCCGIRADILAREIVPAIQDIAKSHNLPVVDLSSFSTAHPELLPDGVHPNDKGYEAVAAKVREVLTAQPPKPQREKGFWSKISH